MEQCGAGRVLNVKRAQFTPPSPSARSLPRVRARARAGLFRGRAVKPNEHPSASSVVDTRFASAKDLEETDVLSNCVAAVRSGRGSLRLSLAMFVGALITIVSRNASLSLDRAEDKLHLPPCALLKGIHGEGTPEGSASINKMMQGGRFWAARTKGEATEKKSAKRALVLKIPSTWGTSVGARAKTHPERLPHQPDERQRGRLAVREVFCLRASGPQPLPGQSQSSKRCSRSGRRSIIARARS
jgi:hypothetical protein